MMYVRFNLCSFFCAWSLISVLFSHRFLVFTTFHLIPELCNPQHVEMNSSQHSYFLILWNVRRESKKRKNKFFEFVIYFLYQSTVSVPGFSARIRWTVEIVQTKLSYLFSVWFVGDKNWPILGSIGVIIVYLLVNRVNFVTKKLSNHNMRCDNRNERVWEFDKQLDRDGCKSCVEIYISFG